MAVTGLLIGIDAFLLEGDITVSAHQIEIIKSAKNRHFRLDRIPVIAAETRIDLLTGLGHYIAFLQYQVTVVDACIESGPVEHAFGRHQDALLEILDIGAGHVVERKIVAAKLAPLYNTVGHSLGRKLAIGRGADIIKVVLVFPKILLRNLVGRQYRQIIFARGQAQTHAKACGCQHCI